MSKQDTVKGRPHRLPQILLCLALLAALFTSACRPAPGPADPGPADDPTDAPAPDNGSDPGATEDETEDSDGMAAPLILGLSIHVEGFPGEAEDRQSYMRHRQALVDAADAAETYGARLSFELSAEFTEAMTRWGDDFAAIMAARGHAIGVHADVGGTEMLPLDEFTRKLGEHKAGIEAQGVAITHVSGICSEGEWVEAAIAAGFDSVTGIVEYCLKSIPSEALPDEYSDIVDCATPADCHGPAPADIESRAHPWRTSTSADWLHHDPAGGVVLVAGESGTNLACLGEGTHGGCHLDAGDTGVFLDLIDTYSSVARPEVPTVLNISWSIGIPPSRDAADAFFAAVSTEVAAGRVAWETLPQIAAHFPAVEPEGGPAADADTPPPADLARDVVQVGEDRWWVRNPASDAWLWVRTLEPTEPADGPLPVVVMVPGGGNGADTFLRAPGEGQQIADAGYLVVVFDPDGRGYSEGEEDTGGFIHQDGLAAVVRFATNLPSADAGRLGVVSYSYGVTMASGALARHPDLPARYLIDWEGPANRLDTGECSGFGGPIIGGHPCDDEAYWVEREASTFIADVPVAYVRMQSAHDHVQSDQEHTLTMLNAAVTSAPASVMLNSHRVRTELAAVPTTWLLSDTLDSQRPQQIVTHLVRLNT